MFVDWKFDFKRILNKGIMISLSNFLKSKI